MAVPTEDGIELFLAVTPETTGRPALRVLYQIEADAARVTIQNIAIDDTAQGRST